MRNVFFGVAIATPLLLINGCASVPIGAGQDSVIESVRTRAGSAVAESVVAQGTMDQRVREWLAEPLQADIAVQIAMLRNPELQLQFARLGISAAEVFDASRLTNPLLSFAVLRPRAAVSGTKQTAGATFGFSDLLLRSARRGVAASEYQRVQQLVAAAILNLAIEVQHAWLDCVDAAQRAAIRQTIAESAQTAAALATRYADAGNISQLTLQLRAAAASEAQIASQAALIEQSRARSRLQTLLGLGSDESQWMLPTTLPTPPAAEASAAQLQTIASAQRLDLAAAHSHAIALTRQLTATHRYRYLGTSEIGAVSEREADGTWRVGPSLTLALPLFNQGQGALARATAELNAARAAERALELQIGNEVQLQTERLHLAREQTTTYRESLIPQREAVVARLAEQANFMLTDTFNLLLAKQQEYSAYEGYVDAVHDYWVARAELTRAVGGRLPEPEVGP
jgi:cobalt-zinc-cadmium efflux system outer membrane protein